MEAAVRAAGLVPILVLVWAVRGLLEPRLAVATVIAGVGIGLTVPLGRSAIALRAARAAKAPQAWRSTWWVSLGIVPMMPSIDPRLAREGLPLPFATGAACATFLVTLVAWWTARRRWSR